LTGKVQFFLKMAQKLCTYF